VIKREFFLLQMQPQEKYKFFLIVDDNIRISVTNRQWHKLYRASVEFHLH
jgi:hypothetical protein